MHRKQLALVAMAMRRVDDDVATGDALVKTLELGDSFANSAFYCGGRLHVPEGDLEGYLHEFLDRR